MLYEVKKSGILKAVADLPDSLLQGTDCINKAENAKTLAKSISN